MSNTKQGKETNVLNAIDKELDAMILRLEILRKEMLERK